MHRDDPTTSSFQKGSTRLHTSGARGEVTRKRALEAIRGAGRTETNIEAGTLNRLGDLVPQKCAAP